MALLPTSQRDQTLFFVAFLGIVGAGAFWYFVYDPKSVELDKTAVHVDSLDAGNQRAKAQLAKGTVAQVRAESERLRANLDLMRTLVPASNEVPALLDQVSTATKRAGLDLGLIEPAPVIQGDQFDMYRYKLRVVGDYHQVGEMLSNIGAMTRIVAPINLQLQISNTPSALKGASAVRVPLNASFEIQTYAVKTAANDNAQRPPAKPAKKG